MAETDCKKCRRAKRFLILLLVLAGCLLAGSILTEVFDAPRKESLAGKRISFMGDSITTYLDWSNNTGFNSTLGGHKERNTRVYYGRDNKKDLLPSVHHTYWMLTVERLGMSLCVNNSWSGSRVATTGVSNKDGCGSRTVNLHNDHTGENPDIIVVYMGTNDFNTNVPLGIFNTLEDIYDEATGTYTGNLKRFAPAYATMVHKIKCRYPDADIYLCTIDHYRHKTGRNHGDPSFYNRVIEKVAAYFQCNIVDFYRETPIFPETAEKYTLPESKGPHRIHPNAQGMEEMFVCLKEALSKNYTVEEG